MKVICYLCSIFPFSFFFSLINLVETDPPSNFIFWLSRYDVDMFVAHRFLGTGEVVSLYITILMFIVVEGC
jgi:hypothetical protein